MVALLAAWLMGMQIGAGQNAFVSPAPAVVLQVTMPSGAVNRLTIASGGHGSVGAVLGPTVDLSPTLRDDGTLEIVATPVAWNPATSRLSTGDAERQLLRPGETASLAHGTFPISVKWLGSVATAAPAGSSGNDPGPERCCIACGSEVVCGCAVVTPCGDCCATSCGCQGGGTGWTDGVDDRVRSLLR